MAVLSMHGPVHQKSYKPKVLWPEFQSKDIELESPIARESHSKN